MKSIRRRMLAITSVAILATFVIAGGVVYRRTRDVLRDQLDASLAQKARALAQLVEYDEVDGLEADLPADTSPGDYLEFWDDRGVSAFRSRSLGAAHLERATPRAVLAYRDARLPDGTSVRQVQFTFPPRQELGDEALHAERPVVTLAVATSTATLAANVAEIRMILVGVGALATVLALVLLAWLIRVGLRPVDTIARTISAIDAETLGNASPHAIPDVPVELLPITTRLGELLARLDRAFTRERELTGELAHELRTPLAGLRTTIEVALGRERTSERYRETLTECLAICAQTERTVEMLLALARLDGGSSPAGTDASCSVDDIVREGVRRIDAVATARGLVVEVALAPHVARFDREHLRVVFDNLLDNAVAYAEPGTIRVQLAQAALTVSNATALTSEQAAHVFERFWRADQARTAGHAGLGLALCKKLVLLAGGSIVASVADGRFVVTVTYPT